MSLSLSRDTHVRDARNGLPWCLTDPRRHGERWKYAPFGVASCPWCRGCIERHRDMTAKAAAGGQAFSPTLALSHWRYGDDSATLRARVLERLREDHGAAR